MGGQQLVGSSLGSFGCLSAYLALAQSFDVLPGVRGYVRVVIWDGKGNLPAKWGFTAKVVATTFAKGGYLRSKFHLGVSGVFITQLMGPLRLKIIKQ